MFCDEVANSPLSLHPPDDLHQLVALRNSVLASILDKHAPVKRRHHYSPRCSLVFGGNQNRKEEAKEIREAMACDSVSF